MHRIVEVRRLDHVVLLVAAQAVLRPEGRGQLQVAARGEGVERMREACGHRRRMGEQRDAATRQRPAQFRLGKQPVDAELHHVLARSISSTKPAGL